MLNKILLLHPSYIMIAEMGNPDDRLTQNCSFSINLVLWWSFRFVMFFLFPMFLCWPNRFTDGIVSHVLDCTPGNGQQLYLQLLSSLSSKTALSQATTVPVLVSLVSSSIWVGVLASNQALKSDLPAAFDYSLLFPIIIDDIVCCSLTKLIPSHREIEQNMPMGRNANDKDVQPTFSNAKDHFNGL